MSERADVLTECAEMAKTWASCARFAARKMTDPIEKARTEGGAVVAEQLARVFDTLAAREVWQDDPTPSRETVVPDKARR